MDERDLPVEKVERKQPTVRDRRKVHSTEEPETASAAGSGTHSGSASESPSDDAAAVQADSASSELEKIKIERDAYLDDLRRLKAEFENYRKRILKEQTEIVERASAALVARLLAVLDNFELAVAAAEETRDFEKMLRGVELVYGQIKEILRGEGLTPIDAKGKPFDPTLHEAAIELPGEEQGDLVVAEVLRTGYMFKNRVLRPAMVKVVRRPAPAS
jgi:molecular chaperone GrpE